MQHLPQSRSLPVSQSRSLAVLQSTICSDLWRFSMRDHDSAAESLLIFGPQMREVKRKSTICSALLLAGRETEQKTAEDCRRLVDGWTRETAAAAAAALAQCNLHIKTMAGDKYFSILFSSFLPETCCNSTVCRQLLYHKLFFTVFHLFFTVFFLFPGNS